jgi:hypothetical protein
VTSAAENRFCSNAFLAHSEEKWRSGDSIRGSIYPSSQCKRYSLEISEIHSSKKKTSEIDEAATNQLKQQKGRPPKTTKKAPEARIIPRKGITVAWLDDELIRSGLQKYLRRGMLPEALFTAFQIAASGKINSVFEVLIKIGLEDIGYSSVCFVSFPASFLSFVDDDDDDGDVVVCWKGF